VTLHPEQVQSAAVLRARQAGVSDAALSDALYVCALFNAIDRIADALNFSLKGPDGSWYLLNVGYRL
jgi:alkylhydroperoxidase family enzyme